MAYGLLQAGFPCKEAREPPNPQGHIDVHIDPAFIRSIDYLDLKSISESRDVIYIVDDKLVLRAFNDAWVDFAGNNGGESVLTNYPLGAAITQAFPAELKHFFITAYKKVLKGGQPFHHECECSSAHTFRRLHQSVYSLLDARGLVISNHFVVECDHTEKPREFSGRFADENGLVTQCANCRKLRDPRNPNVWVWVPSAVEKIPDRTSHGICPRCFDYYFYSDCRWDR